MAAANGGAAQPPANRYAYGAQPPVVYGAQPQGYAQPPVVQGAVVQMAPVKV